MVPQGRQLGNEAPRSPRSPACSPPRLRELSSSRIYKKRTKKVEKASVSTPPVLNKYNTNYEALRLTDSTAFAFNLGKILLKLFTRSG